MKKIIIAICFFMLAACKNAKSESETPIYADEAVLVVNYKLENMTLEEHAELGAQVAPNFVSDSISGLLGKSFIGNLDRGVFGGIYYFENRVQPDAFSSIFSSLWWSVVTLTTVGYGDIVPITIGGRIFTFIILMIALGIIAIPSGMISSALTEARAMEKEEMKTKAAKDA